MDNNPEESDENRIAPQPFNLMIALAIISIILSYPYFFCTGNYKTNTFIIGISTCILLLFTFKTYLLNFTAHKAIYWLNRNIAFNILFTVFYASEHYINIFQKHSFLLGLPSLLVTVALIATTIKFGNSLRKVENDYVGLMKELGISFSYLLPAIMIIAFILLFIKPLRDNIPLKLIENTLLNIPTFIMILIFYRAKKYLPMIVTFD